MEKEKNLLWLLELLNFPPQKCKRKIRGRILIIHSRQMGKGIVIDTVHFLGDTLWHMKAPKGTMGKSDDK